MLDLKSVYKVYRAAEIETVALADVSLQVAAGEFVAITGPSGCGKSTLLNLLGLLDDPTNGDFNFCGHDVRSLSENRLTDLRRDHIGFVFQSFNLIEDLTVEENVEVALIYRGVSRAERARRVAQALDRVGIGHRARHLPRQLSGGQQQRVAVARALVSEPKLILADEPTGNLDAANGEAVMEMLRLASSSGVAVIMVTHSLMHAAAADRIVALLDGKIVSPSTIPT